MPLLRRRTQVSRQEQIPLNSSEKRIQLEEEEEEVKARRQVILVEERGLLARQRRM